MKNYIYLVCTAHSGSTLIGFLLGNHPQIATVGEVAGRTDYDNYPCSCGNIMIDCPFWISVKKRFGAKGMTLNLKDFGVSIDGRKKFSAFDRLYDYYAPAGWMNDVKDKIFSFNRSRKKWIDSIVERNILLAETITKVYGKESFLDTTKDLYRLKHLIKILNGRLKVLYITRDGRGVMNSLMKKEKLSERHAINAWIWSNSTINRIVKNFCSEEQFFQLKYEDLCADTESRLKEIYSFVGVSPDIVLGEINPEKFHILGNVMRKTFTGKISMDEKWKMELNEEQLCLFEKYAGEMNRKLGYQ